MIQIVAALSLVVLAHSWYPEECCSGGDCAPVAAERVTESAGGFTVDGTRFVPHSQTRPSPDGDFHACPGASSRRQEEYDKSGGFTCDGGGGR